MRSADVLDQEELSEAERAAVRLDGDAFALGLAVVPIGAWVDAALRAASLKSAVAHHGLVVASCTAAWVHGATPTLPNPLTLAVDLRDGRRTRAVHPAPREVRFVDGDVQVLGGVRTTTPFRTAFDLACYSPAFEGDVVRTVRELLALAGLDPAAAATAGLSRPPGSARSRGFARLLSLRRLSPR